MHKLLHFFTYFTVSVFFGCAPSQPVSKPETYSQDLTRYRVRYEALKKSDSEPAAPRSTSDYGFKAPEQEDSGEVNRILEELSEGNKALNKSRGFRVQIYSGNSRSEAEEIVSKSRSVLYGEDIAERPEIVYEEPNYKAKIGNYFTRIEAYKIYKVLKKEFPSVLIVSDEIDLDEMRRAHR